MSTQGFKVGDRVVVNHAGHEPYYGRVVKIVRSGRVMVSWESGGRTAELSGHLSHAPAKAVRMVRVGWLSGDLFTSRASVARCWRDDGSLCKPVYVRKASIKPGRKR